MTTVLEDRTICESQKACAEACPMRCATSPIDEVAHIAHILETQGRFGLTRGFIQHGTMSVHAHVISVAHASIAMAGSPLRTPASRWPGDSSAWGSASIALRSSAAGAFRTTSSTTGTTPTHRIAYMGSRTHSPRSPARKRTSKTSPRASATSSPVTCSRWFPSLPPAAKHGWCAWPTRPVRSMRPSRGGYPSAPQAARRYRNDDGLERDHL